MFVDASRLPQRFFNDAHLAPNTCLYDASRLPWFVCNDARQAPTTFLHDASRPPPACLRRCKPRTKLTLGAMLAGSPGLSSMTQTRHQTHALYDASRLPRLVFHAANQAPTNMFVRCWPAPPACLQICKPKTKLTFGTMLAGPPGLSSIMQARHQKHFLGDASRLPRLVFNAASQAPIAPLGRC